MATNVINERHAVLFVHNDRGSVVGGVRWGGSTDEKVRAQLARLEHGKAQRPDQLRVAVTVGAGLLVLEERARGRHIILNGIERHRTNPGREGGDPYQGVSSF